MKPLSRSILIAFSISSQRHLGRHRSTTVSTATSFSTMSWMDSWSRPGKSQSTPAPYYLTDENVKYCQACGRIISDRKSHKKENAVIKYCSDGCRKRRIGPADKKIDKTILALLMNQKDSGIEKIDVKSRMKKGDHRNLIFCDEIEAIVFERTSEESTEPGAASEDKPDPYVVNNPDDMDSQGNRPNPTGPGSAEKRNEGQKRADERETVRRAARRAVVFGYPADDLGPPVESRLPEARPRRKCEAVMNGQVVEPSFAKGNWAIRWREEV